MAWPMAKKDIVVRYSDAAPQLMAAMDYCNDNGTIVDGLSFNRGVRRIALLVESPNILLVP